MFIKYNTLVRFYFKQYISPVLFKTLNEIMLLFNIYFDLLVGKELQLAPAEGCSLQLFVQAAALLILTCTISTDSTPDKKYDGQPWWGGSKHPNIHSLSMLFWVPVARPHLTGLSKRFALQELPPNSSVIVHSACPRTAGTYFIPSGRKAGTRYQVTPSIAHHRISPHVCFKDI